MFKRPPIPERLSSLMAPSRLEAINAHRHRAVSASSQLSQASINSDTSDFFDAKIAAWETEVEYIRCVKNGLDEAKAAKLLSDAEFRKELEPYLEPFRAAAGTLQVMKRDRQLLVEDFEEEVEVKRQRSRDPDRDFMERAYVNTIVPRVMALRAKQKAQRFDQSAFKRAVFSYYGMDPRGNGWCHILGIKHQAVKAAHLVPKSLTKDEVSHLFGDGEAILSDPRNGITLIRPLEEALDAGEIVIIPMPGETTAPTRWRCIVIDEKRLGDKLWERDDGRAIWFKDVDGAELQFRTDNRPRRRYLYFRFLISYLNAKNNNYRNFTQKVESKRFWPTLGPYLRKSTLVTLARCVSGVDLPDHILEDNTFAKEHSTRKDTDAGLVLGADLRDALIESIAAGSKCRAGDEGSEEAP